MILIDSIRESVRRLITSPVGELNRVQGSVRYMMDLAWHCARELHHDRAPEMAAALTYRTIFSLVPLVMLALLVFNAFGGFKSVGSEVQNKIFSQLGLNAITATEEFGVPNDQAITLTLPTTAPGGMPPLLGGSPSEKEIKKQFIDNIITSLTDKASELSIKNIGIIGLALLIWAALALLITIERTFNRIYDCPTGRAWHLRITIYWAVITLGPVLIFLSLYMTDQVMTVVTEINKEHGFQGVGMLLGLFTRISALLASWLLLFLLYMLMPNTKVNLHAAAIGSFVTAVLYETGKIGFQFYVAQVLPYSKLYGTLGLVPLFLFWIFLTWLIVLFGLELTYTLQAMKGRRFKHLASQNDGASSDPQWMIPVLAQIGKAFAEGKTVSEAELSDLLGLTAKSVADMTQILEQAKLVVRIQHTRYAPGGLTLAVPPEKIPLSRVLELARAVTVGNIERHNRLGWSFIDKLDHARHDAAKNVTLATVLAEA